MARYCNGINEFFTRANPILGTPPIAMCCWFKSDNITTGYCLMWTGSRFVNNHNMALYAQGAIGGDPVRFQMAAGGGWRIADTTTGYSAATWHHACGIWVSATDIRVLIDGGSKGTDLGLAAITINTFSIGVMSRLVPAGYLAGSICEAAMYDLNYWPGGTAAQKADSFETILPSLAAGYSPLHFPVGLTNYWPLNRGDPDNENDRINNYSLTAANTPSVTPHPRIIMQQQPLQTTARSVIPSPGKLKNEPFLTGKIRGLAALTGKMKNEPALTGKMKSGV